MKIQNGFALQPQSPEARLADQDRQIREAAKMYETHFLNEMVKAMRQTVQREDGFIKQNFAEKIFTEQLDQQYTEGWANRGGVGLADMIYNQIREKYLGATQKNFGRPTGALPLAPNQGSGAADPIRSKALPTERGASYRFDVQDPSGSAYDVVAPMPGRVKESGPIGEGWQKVVLDHGQGVVSELTFPGARLPLGGTEDVAAGQKLGSLDPERPAVAWNLDWT